MAAYAGGRALRKQEIATLESLLAEANELPGRHRLRHAAPRRVPDAELPVYTILVPAYREEAVIAKLIENLQGLDYPPEKLDVIVLLEEDDELTLNAAKAAKPPGYVRLFVTPHGTPKTKPRACNAGLRFARGEYLVIYDAEDRPHPAQLHDVLSVFEVSDARTVVVQGRLNYFNASSNLLTRMFALEYAAWFDYMLPGLDALRLPIPWAVRPITSSPPHCATSVVGTPTTSPKTLTSACGPPCEVCGWRWWIPPPGRKRARNGRRGSSNAPVGSRGT